MAAEGLGDLSIYLMPATSAVVVSSYPWMGSTWYNAGPTDIYGCTRCGCVIKHRLGTPKPELTHTCGSEVGGVFGGVMVAACKLLASASAAEPAAVYVDTVVQQNPRNIEL